MNCTIVELLGSEVLDIRQEAMRLFISIMKNTNGKEFIENSLEHLDNSIWRIREEMLNLIIICLMRGVAKDLDYETIIAKLANLVADSNPKVRFVAREAIAVLASKGDHDKVIEL